VPSPCGGDNFYDFFMNVIYRFLGTTVLTLSLLRPCGAVTPPPVPPAFQSLDSSLNGYLTVFNTALSGIWNGSKYPVLFSGTLTSADANAGPSLVASGHFSGVQLELQALQAMGVKAIMVEIGFPMLYEPFFSSESQYQQYVSFYQQVAAAVRALGMQLIIENNCLLSNAVQAGWNTAPFYATLNWTEYQAARAQTAAVIAQTLQPDYLVVLEEPDTEAFMSGQTEANTMSGSTGMLSQILSSVQQTGVSGMKVGAGVGSWQEDYLEFIQSFVTQPLDFIDMHIYVVNNTGTQNFLTNALTIASTAAAAGKPLSMTECWLNKEANNQLGLLSVDQINTLNVYSFWAPLDASFLQTMANLANYTKMTFLAPSNSQFYWAYQTYNSTLAGEPPSQVIPEENTLADQAMQQASYTSTALSYYSAIVSPPDTTPPSTPANLAGGSSSSSTVALTWNTSTDNVGVAGYWVLRNGVKIAKTAQPQFQDSGLAGATTYTYVVEAFDLGGNVSPPSLPLDVTTKDAGAPSPPSNPAATTVSCTQISLTWSASTDINVTSYQVFRGTSPTALSQVGITSSTTTSFSNYSLNPATKYYFGVEAVDNSGNVSAMTPLIWAATLALPSAPAHVTATASSSTQIVVSWTPGRSGMPIVSYQIYRGSTPSSLAQVASRTTTSYTDAFLTPGTEYYYAVQETDSGRNVSPMSATVSATTLAPPSAPAHVTATALSSQQVSVTWSASTGGMPIAAYYIYRGNSSSNLAQVASRTATSYTDTTVTPATTYYYAVQAVDTAGSRSPMSATVPVTTPD
jgi:fibronectin type 3 domain-containing protein